jgi:ATP-dependent helicase/nuclease subunit A
LKQYKNWLIELSPIPAVEKVAGDLGLFVRSGLSPGGDVLAGSLSKGIELLRSAQEELWTVADIVDYLGQLAGGEAEHDGVSLHPGVTPAVRVMNLHKAKGLEAPVVFLADPSGGGSHEPDLHIDRSEEENRGYMVISKQKGWSKSVLALPPGWEEICERERAFEEAETLRLLYVAATRAGSVLVITDRNNKQNPWLRFQESLSGCPELEVPCEVEYGPEEREPVSTEEHVSAVEEVTGRWKTIKRATYEAEAAKRLAIKGPRAGTAGTEHGVEWGGFIHRLLSIKMTDGERDLYDEAQVSSREFDLDASVADEAVALVDRVTDSEIWKRAQKSDKRLAEVPFETLLDKPGRSSDVPLLVRGIIDLAFLEENAWVIVDYKTDGVPANKVKELVEHYRPQVGIYAEAWGRCVEQPVKEIGLYFTYSDVYVEVPLS